MHILFRLKHEDPLQDPILDIISQDAIKAAVNFVKVCCQHTAYISGRGQVDNELELVQASDEHSRCATGKEQQQESTEALILGLPGDVSHWVHKKRKFRHRGGIEGALQAMRNLQENEMGKLEQKKGKGSVKVCSFFALLSHNLCMLNTI